MKLIAVPQKQKWKRKEEKKGGLKIRRAKRSAFHESNEFKYSN